MKAPDASCILCGHAPLAPATVRSNLRVDACPACGLMCGHDVSQNSEGPSGAIATAPGHFDLLIERTGELSQVVERLLAARMPHIKALLGSRPNSWLEVGPGNGVLSEIVARQGGYWQGVEIDDAMAAYMQRQGKNVVNADFSSVDLDMVLTDQVRDNGGFDIAFFSQVFEHVTAPTAFLDKVYSCLRPGGVVYVDVPNNGGLTAWLRKMNPLARGYCEIVPPHHMIGYSAGTLRFALTQAGFETINTFERAYNDPTFGLAHAHLSISTKLKSVWLLSRLVGMGGNLTALARKP